MGQTLAIFSFILAAFAFGFSLWSFGRSHAHTKTIDRTNLFLGLRSDYRSFYARLHQSFPGLHYADEENLPLSWSACTDKQRAVLKEYWIQVFNEWFASTKLSESNSGFLWEKFYAPVVSSALRHYVLRRGLEEVINTRYSFGDYEAEFVASIYHLVEKDILKRSGDESGKGVEALESWRKKQETIGEFGAGGKLDRAWLQELRNIYESFACKRASFQKEAHCHACNLLIMLEKIVNRDRSRVALFSAPERDDTFAAEQIESEGLKILAHLKLHSDFADGSDISPETSIAEEQTDAVSKGSEVQQLRPSVSALAYSFLDHLEKEREKVFSQKLKRETESLGADDVGSRNEHGETDTQGSMRSEGVDLERAKLWLVCVSALKSVWEGNYGVGAVVFDQNHRPVAIGSNAVIFPRFDSKAHAEMNAMDKLERRVKSRRDISQHTLITSLEPCPMCFTRLISSGITEVLYLAEDRLGGMVQRYCDHSEALPDLWRELHDGKNFRQIQTECQADLRDMAKRIFESNRDEIDSLLKT